MIWEEGMEYAFGGVVGILCEGDWRWHGQRWHSHIVRECVFSAGELGRSALVGWSRVSQ